MQREQLHRHLSYLWMNQRVDRFSSSANPHASGRFQTCV